MFQDKSNNCFILLVINQSTFSNFSLYYFLKLFRYVSYNSIRLNNFVLTYLFITQAFVQSIAPLKHPEHDLLTFSVKVSRDGFHPYISEPVLLIVTKETTSDTKFYLINYYSVA